MSDEQNVLALHRMLAQAIYCPPVNLPMQDQMWFLRHMMDAAQGWLTEYNATHQKN